MNKKKYWTEKELWKKIKVLLMPVAIVVARLWCDFFFLEIRFILAIIRCPFYIHIFYSFVHLYLDLICFIVAFVEGYVLHLNTYMGTCIYSWRFLSICGWPHLLQNLLPTHYLTEWSYKYLCDSEMQLRNITMNCEHFDWLRFLIVFYTLFAFISGVILCWIREVKT